VVYWKFPSQLNVSTKMKRFGLLDLDVCNYNKRRTLVSKYDQPKHKNYF
jgi:hypothetical protein